MAHFLLQAVQILLALSEESLEDTITTLNDPDSGVSQTYTSLKAIFDQMRKIFSESSPVLFADQLDLKSQEDRQTIRIINLASLCASLFGANDLGFTEMNDHFLHIFIPEKSELSKDAGDLFLGLKTQMFLTTILEGSEDAPKDQTLDDLFLRGLQDLLQLHHPDMPISQAENDFLAAARERKEMLLRESVDQERIGKFYLTCDLYP